MSKNYLTYPFKTMKITQSYNGSASHLPNSTGKPSDFPIDEAGADNGRDYMFCPCDEMSVVRIYGVGSSGTNTVWLQSKTEVDMADGSKDYVTIMAIHPNDDDLKKLKIGQTFKRGEKMFREGTDGHASGNHIHFSVGKGMVKGTGWAKNSKGKWVLATLGGAMKPEDAFYLDVSFTTIIKNGGLKWKNIPKEYVTNKKVNIRTGSGTKYAVIGTYQKGETITGLEVVINSHGNKWIRTDKGYVSCDNLTEVK